MYYYYYCALQNFNNVSEMYDWRNGNPEGKKLPKPLTHTQKKLYISLLYNLIFMQYY